jgi:hypothetical protein
VKVRIIVLAALGLWCRDDVEGACEATTSMADLGWEGESVGLQLISTWWCIGVPRETTYMQAAGPSQARMCCCCFKNIT